MRRRTRARDAVGTFGGSAMVELEIFTPTGVLSGSAAQEPLPSDGPDLVEPLSVDDARWYPIDGSRPTQRGTTTIGPDDILLIVTPEPELKVHMAHFAVALEVGPYRVSGRLATHPGFDPERSLARPGGTFVALTEVSIELVDHEDAGFAQRPYLHVNRYAVDQATSTLMLGHFFPGARLVAHEAVTVA